MVEVIQEGDIFKSKAQTLVNTVNCIGVMGRGVALEFKKRFPDMHEDYLSRCQAKQVKLGKPYLFRRLTLPWILNFPTKDHWRSVSKLQDIVCGLEYLEKHYREWGITSLAVPPLGCGQGQLEWRVVGPTLYRHLNRLPLPVELYAPYGTPHEELQPDFFEKAVVKSWATPPAPPRTRIEPAWVAIVEILSRLEQEPYHWPVGRITFQKIAYFATESGIPTGLEFQRGSFGPFSPDLKRQATRLVNNGVIREERLGSMFAVKVGSTFEDARKAYNQEVKNWESLIDRVADLFMRIRTHEAELAATVHFAAKSVPAKTGKKPTEREVLSEVMKWKAKHRPRLVESEVALAIRNMGILSWLDLKPSQDLPIPDEALLEA